MFAFEELAPQGWAICDGTTVQLTEQTQALFEVLGNRFGGDGITEFALPDLRGRALLAAGAGPGLTPRTVAERGGADLVVLAEPNLPVHSHEVRVRGNGGGTSSPENNIFGASQARALSAGYSSVPAVVPMAAAAVGPSGGGQPHENMPPYLPVSFCISLNGTIP
jgi:microcystin-dependent protein